MGCSGTLGFQIVLLQLGPGGFAAEVPRTLRAL